jgi:hypothetical protein
MDGLERQDPNLRPIAIPHRPDASGSPISARERRGRRRRPLPHRVTAARGCLLSRRRQPLDQFGTRSVDECADLTAAGPSRRRERTWRDIFRWRSDAGRKLERDRLLRCAAPDQ